MKKTITLFILITAAIIYFSCKSSTTNPSENQTLTNVSGTILNWNDGVKTLKLIAYFGFDNSASIILANTQISANGTFTLNFPESVSDSNLINPIYDTVNCSGNITVSPVNLKVSATEFAVYSGDTLTGYLYNSNDTITTLGTKYVYYNYFNATGAVVGENKCSFFTDTVTTYYNMSFSKGWNPTVTNYYNIISGNYYDSLTCNIPQGTSWRYRKLTDNDNNNVIDYRKKQ